jgi:hypothetical protein
VQLRTKAHARGIPFISIKAATAEELRLVLLPVSSLGGSDRSGWSPRTSGLLVEMPLLAFSASQRLPRACITIQQGVFLRCMQHTKKLT